MLSIFVTVKKMMRSLKRKLKEQGSSGYTCLGLLPDHGYPLGKTLIPAAICRNQGLNSSEVQGLQGSVLGMGRGSTPTRCHPRRTQNNESQLDQAFPHFWEVLNQRLFYAVLFRFQLYF